MCLTVKEGCDIEVANVDITCWKVVADWDETKWMAPVMGTLHNYDEVLTACDRLSMRPWLTAAYGYIIEEGFHAYTNSEEVEYGSNLLKTRTLVKCAIPRGAEYCLGTHNEIVANKIIVHKPKCEK